MTATFPQERVTVSRLHRPALEALLRSLPAILSGRRPDYKGIRAGFHARIGFSVLSLIALDFETLGRGGVGAGGYTWARNTPEYLAYKKGRGAKTRQQHYAAMYSFLVRRGMDPEQARRGTLIELGRVMVDHDQVLVDKGNLRRSLQPGTQSEGSGPDASYTPKTNDQIFESDPTQLVIGSRDKKAGFHHHGKGRRKRRLWPEVFPEEWWSEILGAGVRGLIKIKELAARGDL